MEMREMRRKDRMLTDEETYRLLKETEYGVLSTICPDGTPYGVPISYAVDGNAIYMHCSNAGGQKIENISLNSAASLTAVGSVELLPDKFGTKYMSAIAYGNVHIVDDEMEKKHGMEAILRKYSADYMENGLKYFEGAAHKIHVLRMDIDSITGKGRKK